MKQGNDKDRFGEYRYKMNSPQWTKRMGWLGCDLRLIVTREQELRKKMKKVREGCKEGDALVDEWIDAIKLKAFICGIMCGQEETEKARPDRSREISQLESELARLKRQNELLTKCIVDERNERFREMNTCRARGAKLEGMENAYNELSKRHEAMKEGYKRHITSLKARIEELEKPKLTFWQRFKNLF